MMSESTPATSAKRFRFSLLALFVWLTLSCAALACLAAAFNGKGGRPIGYGGLVLALAGFALAAGVSLDILRRVDRFLFIMGILGVVLSPCLLGPFLYDKTHWSLRELSSSLYGMSKEEVRLVLGEPFDIAENGQWWYDGGDLGYEQGLLEIMLDWQYELVIEFDEEGKVVHVDAMD